MIQPTELEIDAFWTWFASKSNEFGGRFENEQLIDELDARIARLGEFAWEIGPGVSDSSDNALVLSPGGDASKLAETRRVISRAPTCKGWEFYAAKPIRKCDQRFVVYDDNGNEVPVDARDWRYVLFRFPDGVYDIVICAPNIARWETPFARTAAEIALDGALGEERRLELIHNIEIVAKLADDITAKSTPIAALSDHLQSLARDARGKLE